LSPEALTIPADKPGPSELDALAEDIRQAVGLAGWAHVQRRLSEPEFETLARKLGTIELRTDLVVDPEVTRRNREARRRDSPGRPALGEAAAMDFHTDRPLIDLLGWYCVEPDQDDGANLLIDTQDLAEQFSAQELDDLGRIEVGYAIPIPVLGGEN